MVLAIHCPVHAGGRRGRGHGHDRLGLRERLGSHAYTSSGSSSSWTQTGNYASGSGSITQSGALSGLSVAESLQSQWQEGYTITSLPGQATTTTGGASGNSQASGVASSYSNYGGLTESAGSSGSGYSYSSGSSWSSGNTAVDHYNDQTTWSEPYTAVGQSSGSGSGSGATTADQVWGNIAYTWASGSWWRSQSPGSGSGSGHGSGSGSGGTVTSGSSSSGGSSSGSYNQAVFASGFGVMAYAGYYGAGSRFDGDWAWGEGWTARA